jgi:hypothetical protein
VGINLSEETAASIFKVEHTREIILVEDTKGKRPVGINEGGMLKRIWG